MNDIGALIVALATGIGFGLVHFWGLWMTIKALPKIGHPALLMFVSFVLRTTVCVSGFYVVSGGRWERLVISVVGFVAARSILIHYGGLGPEAAFSAEENNGDIAG